METFIRKALGLRAHRVVKIQEDEAARNLVVHLVVWVGRDRDAATMKRFFAWLGPRRARAIHTVCCDM